MRPAVSEMQERGEHLRTCSCAPPLTSAKRLADGFLSTHQISAQSVQPFPRYGNGAHLHVLTCRCTAPMTCVICIAAWSHNHTPHWVTIGRAIPVLCLSFSAPASALSDFLRRPSPCPVFPFHFDSVLRVTQKKQAPNFSCASFPKLRFKFNKNSDTTSLLYSTYNAKT